MDRGRGYLPVTSEHGRRRASATTRSATTHFKGHALMRAHAFAAVGRQMLRPASAASRRRSWTRKDGRRQSAECWPLCGACMLTERWTSLGRPLPTCLCLGQTSTLRAPPGDGGGTQNREGSADGGARRPVGGGGGSTGKRQRERAGGAAKEAASLIQCVLQERLGWVRRC